MSSARAMEDAGGGTIDEGPIRELRRLIYCGDWIESHSLHVYLLHAPDFLGYPGFVAMARDHPLLAEQGLQMKRAGNALMALVGGREVHPINIRVGGFYRAPTRRELQAMVEPLERARETALETVRWTSRLAFPDVARTPEVVALAEPDRYPVDLGRVTSDAGLDVTPGEFADHLVEEHVEHSTALHARLRGRGAYLTGSLARYNLSSDSLRPAARDAARPAGLGTRCHNPFQSIIVRATTELDWRPSGSSGSGRCGRASTWANSRATPLAC
jgi:coenzyme F420-reducing hydrogenase alpha subunit